MPMLIEHIDAIARKKQCDVLYVTFSDPFSFTTESRYDWEIDPMREEVCQWLTEHQISWQPCGDIANENMMISYQGQIYIDIPNDENDPGYRLVRDYLENPDGSMSFPKVTFWCLPLPVAMQNAHHDEPGFWGNWAENF